MNIPENLLTPAARFADGSLITPLYFGTRYKNIILGLCQAEKGVYVDGFDYNHRGSGDGKLEIYCMIRDQTGLQWLFELMGKVTQQYQEQGVMTQYNHRPARLELYWDVDDDTPTEPGWVYWTVKLFLEDATRDRVIAIFEQVLEEHIAA